MKKWILIALMGLINFTWAQENDIEQMTKDVFDLADDKMSGREVGTEGEQMAAQYIIQRMELLGLLPKGDEGSYIQAFSIKPKANPHGEETNPDAAEIQVKNVIGYYDNQADQTIVIGAHYDHLGSGAEGSLYAGESPEIHNGADDNASGIAVMLNLANRLQSLKGRERFNYLFIAFSGEERGLWGSNYFCKNPTIKLEKVNYMINLDMVGRYDSDKGIAVNGVGTTDSWEIIIDQANTEGINLLLSESGVGPSDHTSFYLQNIPVLHFFTGQHKDYHKPSDDADKVNIEGMAIISDIIMNIISESMEYEPLKFKKTKDESSETPRFTVTLGVMPDYMFQGNGMRIDGVTEGKPASKAGFEAGDVVIKMGEHDVTDMMSYMKALSQFKKGDKTQVTVLRKDKKIKETIVF